MTPSLRVEGLGKRYGERRVLSGVDLVAGRGEILAVLGANGAGKTTLLSIIAGITSHDEGDVRVLGVDVRAHPKAVRGRIGWAAQDTAVYPTHTVEENLRYFGTLGGVRRGGLRASVDAVMEALDLTRSSRTPVRDLSGGQRRRVHAACALVHRPELILLDEPTVGADPETRRDLLRLVAAIARDGATVLYTSHYLGEIEDLDARVVVLGGGRCLAEGPVSDLVSRHARSELVLRFHGPPPTTHWPGARVDEDLLRLPTADPAIDIIKAVEWVGAERDRLRSVDIAKADLESAYFNILRAGSCP
ncbi:ABC transporter ATP-binding protein [Nocardiopsis sp. MG754419]|uniref:ABC transporter ATP-binding protein n=1 Tax=Nocardiopsis sp. MG754419 TaxID=2259865 RepID=UPI001BA902DA|nr:ABC transporter ATP-binding protein [Nocardiopsis sp. MG754419]MBR8740604.1 ABC transporter ATP-binding protein [Nocardiopsis sp. MG754419]